MITQIDEGQELPVGWLLTSIGEIAETIRGVTYKKEDSSLEASSGLIPILRATNIGNGLDFNELVYVPPNNVSTEQLLRENDIVIAASSGSRAIVGKAAILSNAWKGSFGAFCYVLRPNPIINARLLAYFLQTSEYRNQVSRLSAGVNINNLRREHIESIPYRLAPNKEQPRIAEKLDEQFTRLDAAVAALKRVQANLKRYRAAVLKAACEGRLVPTEAELARREGRSYEPTSVLFDRILATPQARWEEKQLDKLKASGKFNSDVTWKNRYIPAPSLADAPLPQLPEGWLWATTGQVGDVQLGRQRSPKHHSGTHMRPYLRVANVFEDRIDTSDILTMNFTPSEFKTFELKSGDILLNEGQSLELVGRAALYRDEVPGACFQNTLIRFRPYPGVDASFALLVFRSYLHNQRFQKIARWTTNIAHLGAERLSAVEFPVPPRNEQLRIVAEADRQLSIINEIGGLVKANLARANNLRQSILKKAFEGRLVAQNPSDESASLLLERIRTERNAMQNGTPTPPRGRRTKEAAHVA